MTQITIFGQVLNGNLLPEQSLALLEGRRVIATLTVVPHETASAKAAEAPTKEKVPHTPTNEPTGAEEFDPEPPEWLQVEKDLYFPMTVPEVSLGKVSIRVEEGKPCIILPEELPDD